MGEGLSFRCKRCNHEYGVYTGVGMGYPTAYRELLDSIAAGKLGTDLQQLYNATPLAAVNAERIVYLCSGCGNWESGIDLTLWAPDNPEQVLNQEFGEKTVREWGYVPYVWGYDLQEHYHVVKRHYHTCSRCGKRMHKASSKEMDALPCPECGEPNRATGFINWD